MKTVIIPECNADSSKKRIFLSHHVTIEPLRDLILYIKEHQRQVLSLNDCNSLGNAMFLSHFTRRVKQIYGRINLAEVENMRNRKLGCAQSNFREFSTTSARVRIEISGEDEINFERTLRSRDRNGSRSRLTKLFGEIMEIEASSDC